MVEMLSNPSDAATKVPASVNKMNLSLSVQEESSSGFALFFLSLLSEVNKSRSNSARNDAIINSRSFLDFKETYAGIDSSAVNQESNTVESRFKLLIVK